MKRPMLQNVLICAGLLLIGSCSRPVFYWGNYTRTLYNLKKHPDEGHRTAHKKELLRIIKQSQRLKRKVPPGVYCECGYIMYQEGTTDDALSYFDLEEQVYPESSVFIRRLRNMITGQKSSRQDVHDVDIGSNQPAEE